MYSKSFAFDIEVITDTIMKHVTELMTDKQIVGTDYSLLKEKFGKVIYLKKDLGVESLDIIFVWDNKNKDAAFNKAKFKKELAEIYNRLNYKLTQSKDIVTYFRGAIPSAPSFHFPAGLNIWFLTADQFMKSKSNPIIVFNYGVNGLYQLLSSEKYNERLKKEMKYYEVDINAFFDLNKHVQDVWDYDKQKKAALELPKI